MNRWQYFRQVYYPTLRRMTVWLAAFLIALIQFLLVAVFFGPWVAGVACCFFLSAYIFDDIREKFLE